MGDATGKRQFRSHLQRLLPRASEVGGGKRTTIPRFRGECARLRDIATVPRPISGFVDQTRPRDQHPLDDGFAPTNGSSEVAPGPITHRERYYRYRCSPTGNCVR